MISAHNYFPFLFDLYLFVYISCPVRPYEARTWEERRGSGGVPSVLLPECSPNLSLLAPGQPDVHHPLCRSHSEAMPADSVVPYTSKGFSLHASSTRLLACSVKTSELPKTKPG
jgi:hypothetical protein